MKFLSYLFGGMAILLSDLMCAVIAFNYCNMLKEIEYNGASAPASTAFIYGIPFLIGIAVCVILCISFRLKFKKCITNNTVSEIK